MLKSVLDNTITFTFEGFNADIGHTLRTARSGNSYSYFVQPVVVIVWLFVALRSFKLQAV